MSGVAGNKRIESREAYRRIFGEYYDNILSSFPGVIDSCYTGSIFYSNKQSFGDIDLILHLDGKIYKTLKIAKQYLISHLLSYPDDVICAFSEDSNYPNKRTYNAGELISASYKAPSHDHPVQIDNIIALSHDEYLFKINFLNLPAQKQGVIIAATKIVLMCLYSEYKSRHLSFKDAFFAMGIGEDIDLDLLKDQELEFTLSSSGLQLRKISYVTDSLVESYREILWKTCNWKCLEILLCEFDLDLEYDELARSIIYKFQRNKRACKRFSGVYNSMVTVKKGEIATDKALDKIKSRHVISDICGI